jgi:hypothetical protein
VKSNLLLKMYKNNNRHAKHIHIVRYKAKNNIL